MTTPLRILVVDDSEDDALLLVQELRRGGFQPTYERVDTAHALRERLGQKEWEIVVTDHAMPGFSADEALAVLRESGRDVPLLLVSGQIETEAAVELLRSGVSDYIDKRDLSRLVPAVERELRQADIRRQRQSAEKELRLLGTAVASAANAVVITGRDGAIQWTNDAFQKMSGYRPDELNGKTPRILKSGVQPAAFYENLWKSILSGQVWTGEVVERDKSGRLYTVQQTITPLLDEAGLVTHFVVIHEDVTRRKDAEARVELMANRDVLTGLPNRRLLGDRLAQAMRHAKRSGELVGLLAINLDHVKVINDTLGYASGDAFLQEVARRLETCVGDADSLARVGGDEFAVIQTNLKCLDGAARTASKIVNVLSQAFEINGRQTDSSCRIGIAVYPLDDPDGQRLLEKADMAVDRAKAEGRNGYAFYTGSLDSEMHARRTIEMELTQALAHDELVLHYQPQIDLATRALTGMEALVRWQHPTRGLLMPAAFLPAAEASGLILPLSEYVIRRGCRQLRDWQQRFPARLRLAINISAAHLRDNLLLQTVAEALEETGLDARSLEFELTETALIQDERNAIKVIGELARLGILISIDDFGTGYSSLKYLKQLAIEKLKIDQSFVRNLPYDPDDAAIVRGTIELGHQLGLRVIGEGIETDDQCMFLKEHHCDEGQGYLFFRPLPPDKMEALLKREEAPPTHPVEQIATTRRLAPTDGNRQPPEKTVVEA